MAPKSKLLIYNNVKEGWKIQCKFFKVPVPANPFPHRNKKGTIMKEFMQTHPVFKRIQLEALRMRGCVDAWVRGCVDAWMRGCVDAWMRGCVDAWMRGCVDA